MSFYHYTSEGGFKGVVLNTTIRLIQSTHSNNEKDTVHIHDLIDEDMEYFCINDDIRENRVIEMILKAFNNFREERANEGKDEKSNRAFVVCYTDMGDKKSF